MALPTTTYYGTVGDEAIEAVDELVAAVELDVGRHPTALGFEHHAVVGRDLAAVG